jgi:predicted amidohydrolase YtcJ
VTNSPTLRFINGSIVTMDVDRPAVGEVVTQGGRIVWIGNSGDAPIEFRRARTIDLKGRLLLPAFTDAHTHFLKWALSLDTVDLTGATSVQTALKRIRGHAQRSSSRSQWLTGAGFDVNLWGGVSPTRHMLDRICPDRPVVMESHDEHAMWVNSETLRRCRIDRATPDPDGGRIVRDARGEPTGMVLETVCNRVWEALPKPTHRAMERAVLAAQRRAHAVGVVAIGDMGVPETLSVFQSLHDSARLRLRLWKSVALHDMDSAIALGLRSGIGNEWITIGAVKVFLDGALGSRTAWMYQSYSGDRANRGICRLDQNRFDGVVRRATSHGLSICVHAIGDAAVGAAIDVMRKYNQRFPRCQPPRIEHLQLLQPNDLKKLVGTRIIASMQPSHLLTDRDIADRHWGTRARNAFALRSLWDAGVPLAFGSDVPIEPLCPLDGIGAAVHRARPDDNRGSWHSRQRLSVWEAVWGFTAGAAYACGGGERRGRILPGQLADLVVLDRNIFTCRPADIFLTKVDMAVVGGTIMWDRANAG